MGALKVFPKDSHGSAYELGFVLQSKSEVVCNEYGLQQATLNLATYNHNWKKFRVARGIFLTRLKCGDDPTRAALRDLNFLGVQTCGFTRNGLSPGKGIFKVVAEGAIFDGNSASLGAMAVSGDDPITIPWNPSTQAKQQVSFHTYKESTQQTSPPSYVPVFDVTLDYYSIELYFEYMARDRAAKPRFLQESYAKDDAGLIVVSALSDQRFKIQVGRTSAWQTNLNVVNGQVQILPGVGVPAPIDEAIWGPWVKYVGSNSQFKQTQAGPYWHVLETNSIQIQPLIPEGRIVAA